MTNRVRSNLRIKLLTDKKNSTEMKLGTEHLVKIGLMGVVGRFDSPDFMAYPRDSEVICRTDRGLEHGVVLCPLDDASPPPKPIAEDSAAPTNRIDGQLLRRIGSEDKMILERLDRYRDKAFRACENLIAERDLSAVLVDVEHLFDGESVFFYFLGDVDPELEQLTHELGTTYERKVRFKKFAETLSQGCGPDCGTGEGSCGSSGGGCGSCALSGGCGSKKK